MNQPPPPPPPPPASPPPPPPPGVPHQPPQYYAVPPAAPVPAYSPRPQVVHVVAKPGGFWRAMTFVIGLLVIGFVFFLGVGFGIFSVTVAPGSESAIMRQTYHTGRGGQIAVIPIIDVIDGEQAEFMRMAVDEVLRGGKIRAVVLRVDSPGGGVTASDQIWAEVERLKANGVTVVASYGSMAASGGYYVSCGADYIMAETTCITGSIGVIAQVFTFEGLADKIGVEPVTLVATGSPEKDVANDIFRSWNEDDREKILTMLDASYAIFRQRVGDGRTDSIADEAALTALADGSIYTAQQALDHGLIDGIGYLDDAIARTESLAGFRTGSANVVILKRPPSLFASGLFSQAARATPPLDAESIRTLANDLGAPRVMYLMH